jgi:hypothetical protein
VREINMSVEGYRRIAGDTVKADAMQRCYAECYKLCDFERRQKEVDEFNK